VKLEIKNAGFSYAEKEVFRNVSFTVETGEVLCLLGPNGTGKTTLLKSTLGLLKLESGEILLDNMDISGWSRKKIAQVMGYVPQNHIPPFPFSVIDVVLMGRTAHINKFALPTKLDQEIAREALACLNISNLSQKNYCEISGGERQLVLIARALAQKPQILVMDEPTSSLDYGNQLKVLGSIKSLTKKGLAVIMSSHSPDHAFRYADKVALMKDKTLFEVGKPDETVTERNLKNIYGVRVKVAKAFIRDKERVKVCIPL